MGKGPDGRVQVEARVVTVLVALMTGSRVREAALAVSKRPMVTRSALGCDGDPAVGALGSGLRVTAVLWGWGWGLQDKVWNLLLGPGWEPTWGGTAQRGRLGVVVACGSPAECSGTSPPVALVLSCIASSGDSGRSPVERMRTLSSFGKAGTATASLGGARAAGGRGARGGRPVGAGVGAGRS